MPTWRLSARLAGRNLFRRRSQTLIVLAGLLVGTAIVTASLTVSDSLRYGIQRAAYDGYGPADDFVQIEGASYFPQSVFAALDNDSTLKGATRALSPIVFDTASVRDGSTRAFEPATGIEGFDAARDAPFGAFTVTSGAVSGLQDNEAILGESLAANLGASVGDTITVGVHPAGYPHRTDSRFIGGNITGTGACVPAAPSPVPPLPVPVPVQPPCAYSPDAVNASTYAVPIERGGLTIDVVLEPVGAEEDPSRADLDILIISPSGNQTAFAGGAPGSPSDPAVAKVRGDPYLERGNWTVRVTTKNGANARWSGYIYWDTAVYGTTFTPSKNAGEDILNDADAAVLAAVGASDAVFSNFTVKGIVAHEGKGAFLQRTGVFLTLSGAQSLVGQGGRINAVKVSVTGDAENGLQRAGPAERAAIRVLDAERANHPDDPAYDHIAPAPVKARALAGADAEAKFYREFLTAVSALTVLAGALLVYHVMSLLASERSAEIATVRALGLTRADVVLSFFIEALALGAIATVVGVVVGLVGAVGILLGFNFILAQVGNGAFTVVFHPELGSLAIAALVGFAVLIVSAAASSIAVSRLDIAAAQRGIALQTRRARGPALAITAFAALLLVSIAAALSTNAYASFAARAFAPALIVLSALPFARKRLGAPGAARLVGGLVLAIASLTLFLTTPPAGGPGRVLGLLRGATVAAGLLVLLDGIPLERWLGALARKPKGARGLLSYAARYPFREARRTRSTVALFAFVMLILVFFSILGTTFTLNIDEEKGGFDIYATTEIPYFGLPYAKPTPGYDFVGVQRNLTRADPLLVATLYGGDAVSLDGTRVHHKGPAVDYVYAYSRSFVNDERYAFTEIAPGYADGRAAFDAVLHDPALAIISTAYTLDETGNPGAHHAGSTLTLHGASGDTKLRVVGVVKEVYLSGVWVHPLTLRTAFQDVKGAFLIRVVPGAEPADVARSLDAAYEPAGMHAVDLQTAASTALEENEQFLRMFQMFLAFGLVLGIASLAVVTARGVIERRRELAILRACGYLRREVAGMIVAEGLLVTLLGTLVGLLAGTLLAFSEWYVTIRPRMMIPFAFSYIVIPAIILLTLGAAMLAAAIPAWKSGSTSPADAMRVE